MRPAMNTIMTMAPRVISIANTYLGPFGAPPIQAYPANSLRPQKPCLVWEIRTVRGTHFPSVASIVGADLRLRRVWRPLEPALS